jgi:predicted ribosomally synthesized peptide with nif11-like leader
VAMNTPDSARRFVDRLMNDAQFRESINAAPTLHAKGQVLKAAGYGDVSMQAIQEAAKEQAAALGAGVQVDPARVKRVEELFRKAATDQELQQALQAAATPEAKRAVLAQAGYGDITEDDLRAAAADLAQREELSDSELEAVSGGFVTPEELRGMPGGMAGAVAAGAILGGMTGGPVGACVGMIAGVGYSVGDLAIQAIQMIPAPSDW